MRVKNEETPDTYETLEVVQVHEFDTSEDSININKCEDSEGQVYFHVVHEPPVSRIDSPSDIITLTSFTVGEGETVEEAKKQASNSAMEYYADMDV